jgi:hypothetical protein
MLFDLRGRGRRNTVRVIYIGLALLIGLGLVGFGIGGGFGGGGILSGLNENGGGSGSAPSFAAEVARYRKLTHQQPTNPAAWEGLVKGLLHEAAPAVENGLSSHGRQLYTEASEAWERYVALNPSHPNSELALLMARVYGEAGLNQAEKVVPVLQIAVADRPTSASLWSELAIYAYKAKNTRVGDLAAAKAIALAPAAQRQGVQKALAEAKSNPSGERLYTVNGKTYYGKLGPNGTFTGKEVTPPTKAGAATSTTSTTKK